MTCVFLSGITFGLFIGVTGTVFAIGAYKHRKSI